MQGCPGWSPWTDWTNCTAPCGGGFRERERQCLVDGVRYKLLQTYSGFMVNVCGSSGLSAFHVKDSNRPVINDFNNLTPLRLSSKKVDS